MSEDTLYNRLGGESAVSAAVDIFYDKVLEDEQINFLFDGVDTNSLRDHQKQFLTYAFGGQDRFIGQSLRNSHLNLKVSHDEFMIVAGHLQKTLEELEVAKNLIEEVMTIAASTYDEILNN